MRQVAISFAGEVLHLCGSGALWWPARRLLCVSDLHLGKSERIARRGGTMLPPYDTAETLGRLGDVIGHYAPKTVICLGDSFDDLAAADALAEPARLSLAAMQAGRDWIWIEGNHDAGPVELGGSHRDEVGVGPLTFRHIAEAGAAGEITGHYHPKARIALSGRAVARACFALDARRLILPAFGAYTGGLWTSDPAISALFGEGAKVVLTGPHPLLFPMPR
ncbi:ligase-associated DNA damage response endonuclease PdeM [Celeribacter indicus]|uniref:Calcineurin-like phosphoesterase domain-containing protein n=1 Tax=Celeribacter indicus TaxID=1208324 RepID=A0A0B5DQW2_9RHOB|nr:ligase-associated DNA damage response endonuclease PdeM [Celeribacter indicus]AJE45918.1 hypothetical protein P73_1203 [Celeribacter indicus]SDW63722.1 putative phosphoesterase [Celeribacter indicus]